MSTYKKETNLLIPIDLTIKIGGFDDFCIKFLLPTHQNDDSSKKYYPQMASKSRFIVTWTIKPLFSMVYPHYVSMSEPSTIWHMLNNRQRVKSRADITFTLNKSMIICSGIPTITQYLHQMTINYDKSPIMRADEGGSIQLSSLTQLISVDKSNNETPVGALINVMSLPKDVFDDIELK